ncbi:MAG: ABC transporter permease subunit [Candidatus Nezhaarchaeota archaeon]|nr:ABC transporter permease subunit [Candidatus Nezhaarchaeota archaeon]
MTWSRAFNGALVLASLLALWHALSTWSSSPLFPSPAATASALIEVFSLPSSWAHVGSTASRVFVGVLLGSVLGVACGILPRYSRAAGDVVQFAVYPILESIPSICWALIFAVWFGLSGVAPVALIAVAVAPFFIANIWEGVKELDEPLIEMASVFTRSRLRVLRKVVLPMLYPYFFSAFRTAFQVAWKVVIVGELFGAVSGVGYALNIAYQTYAIERVFAWVACCAAIIVSFDYGVFSYLDRRYVRRWRRG